MGLEYHGWGCCSKNGSVCDGWGRKRFPKKPDFSRHVAPKPGRFEGKGVRKKMGHPKSGKKQASIFCQHFLLAVSASIFCESYSCSFLRNLGSYASMNASRASIGYQHLMRELGEMLACDTSILPSFRSKILASCASMFRSAEEAYQYRVLACLLRKGLKCQYVVLVVLLVFQENASSWCQHFARGSKNMLVRGAS